ncbi:MAG: CoA ester lyase [Selenomonadaceae bacterium]|nr:CoA ester lyase [Selenomonadaceae bacterium]
MNKAKKSSADALILDLEDSVPYSLKFNGREMIKNCLSNNQYQGYFVLIRVNSLGTKELYNDLDLLSSPKIDGLMLPKINSAKDIHKFESLIEEREIKNDFEVGKIKFIPLIETAKSLLQLEKIVTSSKRIIAVAFGGEDYLDSINGIHTEVGLNFLEPRTKLVQVARSYDIEAIDTPYLNFRDEIGFRKQGRLSKEIGFSGSLVLTPSQAIWANDIFSPSIEEIEKSKKIVESLKNSQQNGNGVVVLDDEMFGLPMFKRAEKILEFANLIEIKNEKIKLEKTEIF